MRRSSIKRGCRLGRREVPDPTLSTGYLEANPDPLLNAILAGHRAPPVNIIPDPQLGDFCVNASLFDFLRGGRHGANGLPLPADPELRAFLSRVIRSQDAARAGGRTAYSIPRWVETASMSVAARSGRLRPGSDSSCVASSKGPVPG